MEQTNLEKKTKEAIKENNKKSKKIILEQTLILQRLFSSKVAEQYKTISKEKIDEYMSREFTTPCQKLISEIFSNFALSEDQFYIKNMNTADLIFNTLKDKRTQIIYLDNIIKKINEKESKISEVLNLTINDRDTNTQISFKMAYSKFIKKIINIGNISVEDANELSKMAIHYYQVYQADISSTIEQYLDANKEFTITSIEQEMDERKLRGDKTSSIAKLERVIANNSKKSIDSLLEDSITRSKKKSKEELKICSATIINIIFRLLPEKYINQRSLLEVIVDTNINERLGKLLDEETNGLSSTLKSKNYDAIENELYEEKRYKKIKTYQVDANQVDTVYQDVLNEIKIAYDIPDDDINLRKIKLAILSESSSTKNVFINSINNIKVENQENLNKILEEMHRLSKKIYNVSKESNTNRR